MADYISLLPAGYGQDELSQSTPRRDPASQLRSSFAALREALATASDSSHLESQRLACGALVDISLLSSATDSNIDLVYQTRLGVLAYFDSIALRKPDRELKRRAMIDIDLLEAAVLSQSQPKGG